MNCRPKLANFGWKLASFPWMLTKIRRKLAKCRSKITKGGSKITRGRSKIAKGRSKMAKRQPKIAKVRSKIVSFHSKIVSFDPKIVGFAAKIASFGAKLECFRSKLKSFPWKTGRFRRKAGRWQPKTRQRNARRTLFGFCLRSVHFKLIAEPKMHLAEPGVNRNCGKKAHFYNLCAILGTMQLHEAVRAARMELKLSQKKLAEQAKIQRRQLATLEKGGNVTLNTVRKVLAQLPNLETFTIDAVNVEVRTKEPPLFDPAKFGDTVEILAQTLETLAKRFQTGQPPTPEEVEALQVINAGLLEEMEAEERGAELDGLPADPLAMEDEQEEGEDEETGVADEGEERI